MTETESERWAENPTTKDFAWVTCGVGKGGGDKPGRVAQGHLW